MRTLLAAALVMSLSYNLNMADKETLANNRNETSDLLRSPFTDMKIATHEVLRTVRRRACPQCKASRKYYCYDCYTMVGVNRRLIPTVHLPIKVDIVKHQREVVGKSTATHARILAPDEVTIYHYPSVPEFHKNEKVVIVYPDKDALTLEAISKDHTPSLLSANENSAFDRVVFIDSTWQQTHQIIIDKRLQKLPRVKLEKAVTHFWRPQRMPDTCLATIEAIYYFFKEYDQHILKRNYQGQYDNLLYFFAFQYNLIQEEQAKRKRMKNK